MKKKNARGLAWTARLLWVHSILFSIFLQWETMRSDESRLLLLVGIQVFPLRF